MDRTIIVIDLKAFYSFVECIDRHLDPWTTPLVVADKERGKNTIVLSVTPFLKSKGIPSRLRVKELPDKYDYIYATPRMERYVEKSCEVIDVFLDFFSEEDIHVYSIDEAFIDVTSYLSYYKKDALSLTKMVLKAIQDKTGLFATAGIGDNMFLAKVALDIFAKKAKDGIGLLYKKDIKEKLWPITPLSKIWGIGERTEVKLNKLGLFTVGDIAKCNKDYLIIKFGIMGEQLYEHANGNDESDMHEEYSPKERSISIGQVLFKDYNKRNVVIIIREMCDDLTYRLRSENKMAGVVSLMINYSGKSGGFSAQMSLLSSTSDQNVLFEALMEIFKKHIDDKPIRGIHICFGKLTTNNYQQLNVFDDTKEQINNYNLQITIDKAKKRYGNNILLRTSSLVEDSTIRERHSQIGGHRR